MSGFKGGGSYEKSYAAAFKAQIIQEVLKEEQTVAQLAAEYQLHPHQIYRWRDIALAGLPLLYRGAAVAEAQAALDAFTPCFEQAYQEKLRRKLGLLTACAGDTELGQDLLATMDVNGADFTLTFRRLSEAAAGEADDSSVRSLFADPSAYDEWAARWRRRLAQEPTDAATRRDAMLAVNPAYIPRNHRVEVVIRAAVDHDDFAPFHELVTVLSHPFEDQSAFAQYADPPAAHERVLRTFCGT